MTAAYGLMGKMVMAHASNRVWDMHKQQLTALCLSTILSITTLTSCSEPSGPPTVDTTSAAVPTLQERIDFVEEYLVFRRNYYALDYSIRYFNGSPDGFLDVPGPSEWDIRLIAMVPVEEIEDWIPEGAERLELEESPDWLADIPSDIDTSTISEWYGIGAHSLRGGIILKGVKN